MEAMRSVGEVLSVMAEEGLDPHLDGPDGISLEGFCSIAKASEGRLTWSKRPALESGALPPCVVVAPSGSSLLGFPGAAAVIATEDPKAAFFSALARLWGRARETAVAETAVVLGALEDGVSVGEHSYVGPGVRVGSGTIIEHNVTICCPAFIGEGCIIHSGAVIGADGFGYYFNGGLPKKVEHYGGVVIGDRVEIGANACVDRGTLDDTTIGDDVKIDNLVHIAHNVAIEKGAMVVAGAVVCGSASLGAGSYVAPGGIVKNQSCVGEGSLVGLGAVLTKDLGDGLVAVGVPARPVREVRAGDK